MTKKPYSIFITGISGFIGFHLASFLQKRGDYVMGCDNFNDYYSPELKKARAERLKNLGITVLNSDIQNQELLHQTFEKHSFTHIVHLAAQAGVRHSLTHPFDYSRSNLDGFLHILELARTFQPVKLVFASSSSVYGGNDSVPFKESDRTDRPISLYAATKKAGEMMAHTYHHLYNIPMVGLRYFTVYGPWGRPDMAYYSFAKAILDGEPIAVFNHGKMERDFTYVDDIVQGTAAALDYEGPHEIFNLGNSRTETLMDFISHLESALGQKAKLDFKPMQPGDIICTHADISKAKELLGYHPNTSLKEGLGHFAKWFIKEPILT